MRKIRTEIPTFLVIIISIVPKGLLNGPLSTFNCQLLQIPIYLSAELTRYAVHRIKTVPLHTLTFEVKV